MKYRAYIRQRRHNDKWLSLMFSYKVPKIEIFCFLIEMKEASRQIKMVTAVIEEVDHNVKVALIQLERR